MCRLHLILFLFISSCSSITDNMLGRSNFPYPDKFYERFPENKKTIVIIKFDAKSSDESLLWCKSFGSDDNCREVSGLGLYKIFMFEPGMYQITDYSFDEDKYIFEKPTKKILDKNLLRFKANAGEIIYIGFVKKNGSQYEVIDEFDLIERAFSTKNYQELTKLFYDSLEDIEWLVGLSKPIIKKLADAEVVDKDRPKKKNQKESENIILSQSCEAFCNRETLRRREKEIILDKEKYSQKYLQQLMNELNFDKKRCGILTK
jgi:hypothetical protein